jgi:hypothetical protein
MEATLSRTQSGGSPLSRNSLFVANLFRSNAPIGTVIPPRWRRTTSCLNARRQVAGEWSDDEYDALADGLVVGRIFKANASPLECHGFGRWPFGHHEDRTPTQAMPTREAAMAACARVGGVNKRKPRVRRGFQLAK